MLRFDHRLHASSGAIMPVNPPLNRKLRMGLVGGGQGAFIGRVHATAAVLDNRVMPTNSPTIVFSVDGSLLIRSS